MQAVVIVAPLMVVSRKDLTVGSNPGVEARIEGKNQQGQDYESNCRIVMTKSHVYYAVYAVPKGQFNLEDSNRFFGTFTITSPPKLRDSQLVRLRESVGGTGI